jgi:hypothetical protein
VAAVEALPWASPNGKSGCFPSLETIAEAAGCACSSIAGALKALESCGIFSWFIGSSTPREPLIYRSAELTQKA